MLRLDVEIWIVGDVLWCHPPLKGVFMAFEVVAIYALPLALLGLTHWFRVALMRASRKVSIGNMSSAACAAQCDGLPARHLV
jgi:hypothetical protein